MAIFKRGDSPYWWYRIQLDGRMVTGSTNTPDKKLAQRIFLEKHHQFTEEHHLPNQRGKNTSFFWMCDQYLEKHAKVNKKSWQGDQFNIDKLKKHFGDVPLTAIQPQNVEEYKAQRLGFVKQATVNRELALLKVIFSKAALWGYAHRNPVKEVSLFKEERTPIRILTPEERRKLLVACPEFMKPIVTAALKTGMRQGEILALQWNEVDLAHDIISVRNTKAKQLRQIPIHPELKTILEALPHKSAYVFCSPAGERLPRNGMVRDAFRKVRAQLGIEDLTFHMLRHNFATELIAKGADTRTVQAYMGHSSLKMLERYAHLNKGIWRSTIQLLGADKASDNTTQALRSHLARAGAA